MQTIRTSLILLFLPVFLWAQPSNDDCIDAIEISTLDNWCSAISEFSNIDANQSPEATDGGCIPNTQDNDDVWFKFTAIGTDISISVVGDLLVNPGGSLSQPQFVLYSGVCGNLVEEACASDNMNNNQVSIITGPLTVGQEYFISIRPRSMRLSVAPMTSESLKTILACSFLISELVLIFGLSWYLSFCTS